jgi:hypothetical protein
MPLVLLTEYENQNRRRHYPFVDNATMKDDDGMALPADFLVDAHLYPLDPSGGVYIAKITGGTTIQFADTVTRAVLGEAVYSKGAATAEVMEPGIYGRQVGLLVFGPGVADIIRGRGQRTFQPEATTLTPTAYTPIKQVGVRGIRLADGTLITGDISFEGRDGVMITSRIDGGKHILRFDVLGVPPNMEDCGEDPLICTIVVERASGSRFVTSKYDDYTLALTANGLTLDDICEAGNARRRRDDTDPCGAPSEPSVPTPPGDETTHRFEICDMRVGTFMIVTPSTVGNRNPIVVRPLEVSTMPNRLTLPPVTTIDDATAAAERFCSPEVISGGLIMGFQGIGKGQLP